jgi:hypothetical protein
VTITIVATTINAVTPASDRDAKDATDATTNQNAETATEEATTERDATAKDATQQRGRSPGQRARPKRDATSAINAMITTDARLRRIISMRVAPAATTRVPSSPSSLCTSLSFPTSPSLGFIWTIHHNGQREGVDLSLLTPPPCHLPHSLLPLFASFPCPNVPRCIPRYTVVS